MAKDRTLLWIIVILAGLAIVGAGVVAIISSWTSTPYGHAYAAGFKSAILGGGGPGAREVRKAGHCQTASVLASEDVLLADAGNLDMDFVVCILPVGGPEPACADLAKTYVDAVHPPRKFMVDVKHMAPGGTVCKISYDASGEFLESYKDTE